MTRRSRLGLLIATFIGAFPASANLVITPQYDATINNDANAAAIKSVINSAIGVYEGLFSNPISVSIYFQEFTTNSGLGQSDVGRVYNVAYQTFYDGLIANDANPTAIATLNADGGDGDANGGIDPVLGNTQIHMKSANDRAIGLGDPALCFVAAGDTTPATNAPNHCASSGANLVDGIISLNTFITSPPKTLPGNYFLLGTVEHEIDEVLGLGSALPNTQASSGTVSASKIEPEDLWRYDSSGNRAFAVNCASPGSAIFSITGTGAGTAFNNACNKGDFGDWASSGSPKVQDAFATPGASPTLGSAEISALTAIGYTLAAPEPATIGFVLSSLAVFGFLRRRK